MCLIHEKEYSDALLTFYGSTETKVKIVVYIICPISSLCQIGIAIFTGQLLLLHKWLAANNLTTFDYVRYVREKAINPNSKLDIQDIIKEFKSKVIKKIEGPSNVVDNKTFQSKETSMDNQYASRIDLINTSNINNNTEQILKPPKTQNTITEPNSSSPQVDTTMALENENEQVKNGCFSILCDCCSKSSKVGITNKNEPQVLIHPMVLSKVVSMSMGTNILPSINRNKNSTPALRNRQIENVDIEMKSGPAFINSKNTNMAMSKRIIGLENENNIRKPGSPMIGHNPGMVKNQKNKTGISYPGSCKLSTNENRKSENSVFVNDKSINEKRIDNNV